MNIKDVVKIIQTAECAQIATFGKDETEGFPEIRALLNLEEAVRLTLVKNGVPEQNIFSAGVCTLHSQKEGHSFCSYRRTKSKNERMLTAILMQ